MPGCYTEGEALGNGNTPRETNVLQGRPRCYIEGEALGNSNTPRETKVLHPGRSSGEWQYTQTDLGATPMEKL